MKHQTEMSPQELKIYLLIGVLEEEVKNHKKRISRLKEMLAELEIYEKTTT